MTRTRPTPPITRAAASRAKDVLKAAMDGSELSPMAF